MDRGIAVASAASDLDLHENVLRNWTNELIADPQHALPGHWQMKPMRLRSSIPSRFDQDQCGCLVYPPCLVEQVRIRSGISIEEPIERVAGGMP